MKRFWFVIAIAVLGFLFVSNANAIAGKGEKGKIVVEIGDNFLEKKSKTKYFLQRNDTSLVPLTQEHFRDYPPPRPGQRAILSPKGKGKLRYSKRPFNIGKVKGQLNILIALIQPLNEDVPWEAEKAEEYFQSSKDFFEDPHQHSKVTLSVKMTGWLKSDKTKSDLTDNDENSVSIIAVYEALKLADASVDFTEIDCLFIVVADNDQTFTWAWATLGARYTQTDDGICDFSYISMGSDSFSSDSFLNPHELGHALGSLYHEAGENVTKKDACGYTGSEPEEYKSFASVMGNKYSFFSLYTQYTQLGWLDKERVITFPHGFTSVELCPREIAETEKKQLGIIEISDNKHISVELYEKSLEPYLNNDNIKNGLVIREHGEVVNNKGKGGYDTTVLLKEDDYYESFLHPGEEICGLGTKGNISIKYVSLTGEGEEVLAEVEVTIEGAEPTPTPTPTPTHTPTATPTPTPTPTPCEPEDIFVFPPSLTLKRNASGDITVKVTGEDGCAVAGETVTATINKAGKKRLSVSPTSAVTDENGRAIFTITAKKKVGKASITFRVRAEDIKDEVSVKVSNKVK